MHSIETSTKKVVPETLGRISGHPAKRWTSTLTSRLAIGAALSLALTFSGCGIVRQSGQVSLTPQDQVVVAGIANYTETPDAGRSAASIAANTLRQAGVDVAVAPTTPSSAATLFDASGRADAEKTLAYARGRKAKYVLSGAVEEWRYKTGVDGEPVVGVTFELTDVDTAKVIWSATGTRSGTSRSGLATVATRVIGQSLAPLTAKR